jgi:hypothetical protein
MTTVPEPLNDDVVAALICFFDGWRRAKSYRLGRAFGRTACKDFDPVGYSEAIKKEIPVKTALGRAHGDPRWPPLAERVRSREAHRVCPPCLQRLDGWWCANAVHVVIAVERSVRPLRRDPQCARAAVSLAC